MSIFGINIKTLLKLDASAVGIMHVANKFISATSMGRNVLKSGVGKNYRWKHADVFYIKQGSGSPLLLIHHLDPSFSAYEWNEVIDELSKDHTVYAVDLPGCGRSQKPNVIYNSYYYVLFVQSFIKDVIKGKCDVIASGYSSSFAAIAAASDEKLVHKLIAVNPMSLSQLMTGPNSKSKAARILLSLPVLGTSLYNIEECHDNIDLRFTEDYLYNPFRSKQRFVDAFYESAHAKDSRGKYLLGCIKGHFMSVNIKKSLSQLGSRFSIIYGEGLDHADTIISAYKKQNYLIQVSSIEKTKWLPHMEKPEAFLNALDL